MHASAQNIKQVSFEMVCSDWHPAILIVIVKTGQHDSSMMQYVLTDQQAHATDVLTKLLLLLHSNWAACYDIQTRKRKSNGILKHTINKV
jgi:hypothetical protein